MKGERAVPTHDPERAVDDRINAAIGVLWAHLYRGRGRAAITVADTISRLAKEAGPDGEFAGWAGMGPALPTFILLHFGYAPDPSTVLRFVKAGQDWTDGYLGAAVTAKLRNLALFRRSLGIIRGHKDPPLGRKADSLDQLVYSKNSHFPRPLATALLGLGALARGDSAESLRLLQEGTDTLRAYGQADSWYMAALDIEIGKLLLAAGRLDEAEIHLIAATDRPYSRVPAEFYLGVLAERRDRLAEARDHYQRVVRWLRGCDPELRPLYQEALQRSTREPVLSERPM